LEFIYFDMIWKFELREILTYHKFLPDPLICHKTIK